MNPTKLILMATLYLLAAHGQGLAALQAQGRI